MLAYSNNGLSSRGVPAGYVAQAGEALFEDLPTGAQLAAAFAGYAAASAIAQAPAIYAAKIAAGIQIVSTANPGTLSGTYPLTDSFQTKLAGLVDGLNAGKGLPHGASTVGILDMSNAPHLFGTADLENLGQAIEAYVYDLIVAEATILAGGSAAWPAQPVTIA